MGPNYPGYAGRCIFPCCLLQFRINQGQVNSEVENKSRVPRQGPKSEWGKIRSIIRHCRLPNLLQHDKAI